MPARPAPTQQEVIDWIRGARRNWGRWGKDDQRGTVNLITPAKRAAAAVMKKIPSIANVQTQGPAEEAVIEWVEDNKDADSTVINVWSTMLSPQV